jgi:hypothetical protein
MEDCTPHHKATDFAKAEFKDEWVRVKVCASCWQKIYNSNIGKGGARFNVNPGCMTLDHKKSLLGLGIATWENKQHLGYAKVLKDTLWVPANTELAGDNEFFWDGLRIGLAEIEALQGCFALRMDGMADHLVAIALNNALAAR